jgi:hypothetical protein
MLNVTFLICMLSAIMLSVIMLSVIMLSVVILNVPMLSVIMHSVIMLHGIMLNVAAPIFERKLVVSLFLNFVLKLCFHWRSLP